MIAARRPHPTSDDVPRDVLDNLHEGCQVIGFDWTYLYVNETAAAQARRAKHELVGRTIMECFPGIDQTAMFARLRACMAERKHDRMENAIELADGSKVWFELRFIPVPEGTCIFSQDITESKRAAERLERSEEQRRQAQKMEAVSRFAGGVAHDFNNILSVILTYVGLLADEAQENDPILSDLLEVKKASERGAELTKQLLAFSRPQVPQPTIIDLEEVISDMDPMIRALIGKGIELETTPASAPSRVKADRGYLEQVIIILIANARDAMREGGKLTIETANVELDTGRHVMLAVSDTGIGMDKATMERLFEPLFTTKEKGEGTGLGLSTAFGIIRQSGGTISACSEPGKGSTFKIYLPSIALG